MCDARVQVVDDHVGDRSARALGVLDDEHEAMLRELPDCLSRMREE